MLPRCPFCNVEVDIDRLRDGVSRKEFRISGLCQGCQDDIFDAADDLDANSDLGDIEYE